MDSHLTIAHALVNAAHDPCGLLDDELCWSFANAHLVTLLWTTERELIGSPLSQRFAERERQPLVDELRRVAAGRQRRLERQVELLVGDGSNLEVTIVAESLLDGSHLRARCLVSLRDDTELQRRLTQLRLTERALHATTSAVIICDATADDLPIVYVNAAFESLTGYRAAEVLGRNCRFLNEAEREQPGLAEVRDALRERRRTTVVLRNYRKDGRPFWNELTIAPITDATGGVTHFIGTQKDGTSRMEFAAERERLLAESIADRELAARAAKARETLLTVVSHELRAPLNAIRLWVSLLQDGDRIDRDLVRRATAEIDRSVTTQSRIIEDLLDVSRFESGGLELLREPLELTALVAEVCRRNQPIAAQRGVAIDHRAESSSAPVLADRGRIEQVLQNLIDNAVKFTPAGGSITVTVSHGGQAVRVAVRDDGQGIAADQLPNVFDEFWQAEERDTRKHGGLGLGLNLVKRIAERHDGTVEVHSEGEGHGATFTLVLPAHGSSANAEPGASHNPAGNIEGDLLIVDDDPGTVEALAIGLRMRGYEIRVASSADAAFSELLARRPRALISDLMMTGRSGFELAEQLRDQEFERGLDRLPALAITGRGGHADRRQVRLAGFDRHLQKPIRIEALVATLTDLLAAPRPATGMLVVLVCGDHRRGERVRQSLGAHGHEVQIANSAAAALALVDRGTPAVMVAEAELPDGSGATLLDSLRKELAAMVTVLIGDRLPPSTRDQNHLMLPTAQIDDLARLVSRWRVQ